MLISREASRVQFPCERVVELPKECYDEERERTLYYARVRIKNLPDDLPVVIDSSDNIRAYASIRKALDHHPETFSVRNRGLILIATRVLVEKGPVELQLSFEDDGGKPVGGIVYGRHTYEVLKDCREHRGEAIVQVEILECRNGEEIPQLAEALHASAGDIESRVRRWRV